MTTGDGCAFCSIETECILYQDAHCYAIRDGFPISPGHTLIISKRHIKSFFETSVEERDGLLKLIDKMKSQIDAELKPDAYNLGINDGTAAGQTIPHLHIHLIPRYHGDVADPRGGVRWVIPEKAVYWTSE